MYCIRIRPLKAPLFSLDESSTRRIGQEVVQADISGVEVGTLEFGDGNRGKRNACPFFLYYRVVVVRYRINDRYFKGLRLLVEE
jgi:hypothetical protein